MRNKGTILHDKLFLTDSLQGVLGFFCYTIVGLASLWALVRCEEIKEAVCSKVLKVCIGMARLN